MAIKKKPKKTKSPATTSHPSLPSPKDRVVRAPGPKDPLWSIPCPVVGATGEIGQGKTLFALGINPDDETTCIYDLEKSSETYSGKGRPIHRVDVYDEMGKEYPDGYKPYELWVWFKNDIVERVSRGKFRLVVIDPVSELEEALEQHIVTFPRKYGLTEAILQKSGGLKWAALKAEWKRILMAISVTCECLAFTAHMRNKYIGGAPSSQREQKGKTTLMELATLYVELKRKPTEKEGTIRPPSAKILKNRLSVFRKDAMGYKQPYPVLPEFLPYATSGHIRWYMENPVGVRGLDETEVAPAERMSDDDRLALEAGIAQSNLRLKEIESEQLDKKEKLEKARLRVLKESGAIAGDEEAKEDDAAKPAKDKEIASQFAPWEDPEAPVYREHLSNLLKLRKRTISLGIFTDEDWDAAIKKRGASNMEDLTNAKAVDLIARIEKKLPH